MKIDAFLLCYNEEKIIRHTLSYYSLFCTNITILDNESTDGSIAIAKSCYPEVVIKTFSTNQQCREDIQTEMRNNCWKNSDADYVIVCDMDELLYSPDIQLSLEIARKNRTALPVTYGYDMVSDEFPCNHDKLITEQIKFGMRNRMFDKPIIFSPERILNINFSPGSHYCIPEFKDVEQIESLVEFKLLHYKYLGKEYLYKKHEYLAKRLSEFNKEGTYGHEYAEGKKHIDEVFERARQHRYKVID